MTVASPVGNVCRTSSCDTLQVLNDEMCRLELKEASGGMAFALLTFQRGSMDDRGTRHKLNMRSSQARLDCRKFCQEIVCFSQSGLLHAPCSHCLNSHNVLSTL